MLDVKTFQEIVSSEIANLKFENEPLELYEPVRYAMESGGKRIRPVLVLAACSLFTDDIKAAIPAASAFEVFHNFTLLHDDIMDNSPIRRNRPTVHKKWDANTAILSGDAMMIHAYKLLAKSNVQLLPSLLQLFNQTAAEVCEGQQYDMNFEARESVSEDEYLKMIKLKTSVLIAACLKAGAIAGEADERNADALYNFGLNIGLAFQLQDDLLDVYADTNEFGKQRGNDIITGKKTFLLIKALESASKDTKEELNATLISKNISDDEKIKRVIAIYNSLNIKEITEAKIKELYQTALQAIETITVADEKKAMLIDFAGQIMERKK
jgi:geranylgeranyl diphosphate synthase type II